jgi:redox-sensitive bicupin YhaK (pirin superfamily)
MTDHQSRQILGVVEPQLVFDGAGVKIRRSIATRTLDYLDPFLLFDHFGSDNPDDYMAGFPMHPHRGIETVTYMLTGTVNHRDSLGNSGSIGPGDIQWMTSGRGILHEEMPQQGPEGKMFGFQLWINLPAKLKMTNPRYQDMPSSRIPEIQRPDGVKVRVITGTVDGIAGPVTEIAIAPTYLDVHMPPQACFAQPTPGGHTVFAYIYDGEGQFVIDPDQAGKTLAGPRLVQFTDGDFVEARTNNLPLRFLLVMGKPLNEPIARYGPFVMNTREEILQALRDLDNGTFVTP